MTSLNQLCITLGILLSYPVGYSFAGTPAGWRWMVGLGAVPGAILAAGMLVLPESPRWLAGHNRMPQAEAVLRHLRATPAEVARELASLRTDLLREGGRLVPWSALLAPRLRPALVVGVGLAMFQQITGINTVIYFAPPPENATGNWVKVVQRLPVRLELDQIDQTQQLFSGISITVRVDTGDRRTLRHPLQTMPVSGATK